MVSWNAQSSQTRLSQLLIIAGWAAETFCEEISSNSAFLHLKKKIENPKIKVHIINSSFTSLGLLVLVCIDNKV
jgi:hypothetical protein